MVLQDRDLQILQFISKFAYCQERHIMKLCGLSKVNCNKILTRLIKRDYLNKQKVLASSDAYLFLGKNGCELLDVTFSKKIVLNTLQHDTLLVDLYFILKNQYNCAIYTDKELRVFHKVGQIHRVPDLLINQEIAVELEITEKSKDRLQEIVNSYIINDEINQVNYYLYNKNLAQKICNLSGYHKKFSFFIIKNIEDNFVLEKFIPVGIKEIEKENKTPKKFGGFSF
ncbi:MAG TPA: hypothetical protein PKD00_05845 [Burkholderiales bacterium]|nr:hypothetical protein [Burkholderiales bacterium]